MSESRDDYFVDLFVQHQQRVYAYIVTQLPQRHDADEVFQQTNMILLKKWRHYDRRTAFFSWACGVALNEIRNFWRRQRRDHVSLSDEMLALVAQTHQELEGPLQQRLDLLTHCLEKLTPENRAVVEECYQGRDTTRVIAQRMRVTPDALYKRLERIRRLLLECVFSIVREEEQR